MKILLINTWIHHKNLNALLNYKNIEFIVINNINEINNIDLNTINCIFSPSIPLNISLFNKYNIKFIFGPHFSVFPNDQQINFILSNNTIYVQPSEWPIKIWKSFPICNKLNLKILPFGVNSDKFKEYKNINDRSDVFIYYKVRNPTDLDYIKNFLNNKNIKFTIYEYSKYKEDDYINFLKNCKYGIWLGSQESQGFALQEALSCNIPLLVWNVKSINQEYKSNYPDYKATSIPYWDNRCGEYFYNKDDLEETFNLFISKLNNYKPREYILENLTYDICEKKLIDLINT